MITKTTTGTIIDIMDKANDEKFWQPEGSKSYYSQHLYRNSPFESSDSCGNCNGANCDSCVLIAIPAQLEFSIYSDILYDWMIQDGVPEEVASELAYSDSCRRNYKGYTLVWPTENMLKEQYPELYHIIVSPNDQVLQVIKSFHGKFEVFAYLEDAVIKHYGLENGERFSGHVPNQLKLYWMGCNYDHKIACGIK